MDREEILSFQAIVGTEVLRKISLVCVRFLKGGLSLGERCLDGRPFTGYYEGEALGADREVTPATGLRRVCTWIWMKETRCR